MSLPVLDRERLRVLSGGDVEIESELVDSLIEEADGLMIELREHCAKRDRIAARESSHSLKGIAGSVGAIALREAAGRLDAELDTATFAWERFDALVAPVVVALDDVHALQSGATTAP